MDKAEIRSEIRSRLQEDVEDNWTDTQVDRAIERAILTFSREERWPWLYTEGTPVAITVGQYSLALPADIDISRAFNIVLFQGSEVVRPLPKRVTPAEGFALRFKYTSNGKPRYYYPVSTAQTTPAGAGDETLTQTLRFVPAADGSYSIQFQYLRRPSTMTGDTDEPDLPEDYHEAIVARATAALWLTEDGRVSQVKAGEQMQMYIDDLERARQNVFSTPEDEELIWGGKADEREWGGSPLLLPDGYGWPMENPWG